MIMKHFNSCTLVENQSGKYIYGPFNYA